MEHSLYPLYIRSRCNGSVLVIREKCIMEERKDDMRNKPHHQPKDYYLQGLGVTVW